jgi:hypothetical protein
MNEHTNDACFIALIINHKFVEFEKSHDTEECPRIIYNLIWYWPGKTMGSSAQEVPRDSKGRFILGPNSRAHFQTLGINQWECLDCPNMGPREFAFIHLRHILPQIPLKRPVNLPKPPTSTGYFSNSAGASVTNRRFSGTHIWKNQWSPKSREFLIRCLEFEPYGDILFHKAVLLIVLCW